MGASASDAATAVAPRPAAECRARIVDAVDALCLERGRAQLTLNEIALTARISKQDFYRHFEDRDASIAAAEADFVRRSRAALGRSRKSAAPARVLAATERMLAAMQEMPGLTKLVMVDRVAGEDTDSAEQVAGMLASPHPDPIVERAARSGVVSTITWRVAAGRADSLSEAAPEVVYAVLAPRVGPAAALDWSQRAIKGGPR